MIPLLRAALVRAGCLLATTMLAKLAVGLLRAQDGGVLRPIELLTVGHEVFLFAVGFWAVDASSGAIAFRAHATIAQRRAMWLAYGVVAAWSVFNVPVTRVFASPLTASMREAAGGAIADSMTRYATLGTVLAVLLTASVAAVAPRFMTARAAAAVVALGVASLVASSFGGPHRLGVHREPVTTFVRTEILRARVRAASAPSANAAAGAARLESATEDASTRGLDLTHLAGAARGRHVVWVILESTGARYLASYGNSVDPTPNLTRLAAQGVVFENATAVYPESIKGLYAMLCSFSPAPHTPARAYAAARLPCRSIAETMAGEGYATGLWHSGRFAYLGMDHVVRNRGYQELADAKTIGGRFSSSFGTDDMETARAVLRRFDERRAGERVFATYMPIAGHHPYESPGEGPRPFGEADDVARYYSDLYRGDLALGALIEGLKARNVWHDTLLVVHSDHGEAFYQHEGNFAHSLFVYEENLHVPFVIVAPGVVPAGLRARQLISLLDVAPTIASLVGAVPDPRWQGRSALASGPRVVRSLSDHTSQKLALRTGRTKLVMDADSDHLELYDLARDPNERHNRAAADPKLTKALRAELLRWAADQRRAVDAVASVL